MSTASFTGLLDLASARLGGQVLAANDEFFAEKENLLLPGRGIFIADKYTERGKWMDGWETRRRRTPGHDWCVIRLGVPGSVMGVDIDTNHFLGNHPPYAAIEAVHLRPGESLEDANWSEILGRSALAAGSQNLFPISQNGPWTHLRLNIYPDGGVARLRVYGRATPVLKPQGEQSVLDLVAAVNGGSTVGCSDMFFSNMSNLILPGRSLNMGDGWETKRRRGPGHDWVILKLARPGVPKQVILETTHFKGNYPDRCSLDVVHTAREVDTLNWADLEWQPLLTESQLKPHAQHIYERDLSDHGPCTHLRLNIYPDGGVARLRVNCQ